MGEQVQDVRYMDEGGTGDFALYQARRKMFYSLISIAVLKSDQLDRFAWVCHASAPVCYSAIPPFGHIIGFMGWLLFPGTTSTCRGYPLYSKSTLN